MARREKRQTGWPTEHTKHTKDGQDTKCLRHGRARHGIGIGVAGLGEAGGRQAERKRGNAEN